MPHHGQVVQRIVETERETDRETEWRIDIRPMAAGWQDVSQIHHLHRGVGWDAIMTLRKVPEDISAVGSMPSACRSTPIRSQTAKGPGSGVQPPVGGPSEAKG